MKFLLALLLTACSALPPRIDTVLDTTPEPAAAGAFLVSKLDISLPVQIEDGALFERGLYGFSQRLADHYLVVLDYRLDGHAKVMVLIHELAHVMVWEKGLAWSDHGEVWGLAYAEVFRVWVGES